MTPSGLLGLVFVLFFFGLIIILSATGRFRAGRSLREIPAFVRLRRAVGLAVEAGSRIHISLGWGSLVGIESAPALVGLTMLDRIARAASISDRPPVATTGDGSLSILARDTMRGAYRSLNAEAQYNPIAGRLVGLTPFSHAAGTLPVIYDEQVSANIFIGHYGSEIALMGEAAERTGSLSIAGTDSLPGQAVLFVTVDEPLIGEEIFAGGAYLGAGPMHESSLRAQDVARWLVIALIVIVFILKLGGLDRVIMDLVSGIFS